MTPTPLPLWKTLLKPVASLWLTVILLALAMVLIFLSTIAQKYRATFPVTKEYLHSLWVMADLTWIGPRVKLPMPGGYLVGGLLITNLLAAHAVRFQCKARNARLIVGLVVTAVAVALLIWVCYFRSQTYAHAVDGWFSLIGLTALLSLPFTVGAAVLFDKRAGIVLIHCGILLLLISEFLTSVSSVETRLSLQVGQPVNYTQDIRYAELAITDSSKPDQDTVIAFPQALLQEGAVIRDPHLPFEFEIDRIYPNSEVRERTAEDRDVYSPADQGLASRGLVAIKTSPAVKFDDVDKPAAFVTIRTITGQRLGTWLVTWLISLRSSTVEMPPQSFLFDGRTYSIALRPVRYYKPYSVELLEFTHKKYPGTDTPSYFASRIRVVDPEHQVTREWPISMNQPLRYRGETFYQSGFTPGVDDMSVLQVVKNPNALMPYISCALVSLGMLYHFGMVLIRFISRQIAQASATEPLSPPPRLEPAPPPLPNRRPAVAVSAQTR